MEKNHPTIKDKNLFFTSAIMSIIVGIVAGLFSGFAVKLINFTNPFADLGVFIVLGFIILFGANLMRKQVTKV